MTEYEDDVTETAARLTGAGRGESTEIARVSAGRRLREEQERILAEGWAVSGDEGENGDPPKE